MSQKEFERVKVIEHAPGGRRDARGGDRCLPPSIRHHAALCRMSC
jgi:hypothetical protein